MRASRRRIAVLLSIVPLLSVGVVAVALEATAVAATAPGTVNELVSPSGSASAASCPSGIRPTVGSYTNLPSAIAAAGSGNTIYVCAGAYDLSATATYSAGEGIAVNKSVTIDGPGWNSPPPGSDTAGSVNSATQAVLLNGAGVFVEVPNVTINGLTFFENNFLNTTFDKGGTDCDTPPYGNFACATSIDVQSFANGANDTGTGDQGESNVTIDNNLFVDTGGAQTYQGGAVHFGLGQDGAPTDVTALDTGDVVDGNVFYQGSGFENNAVQMSDTNGAVVDGNTVNYPGDDDSSISALWFPGLDNGTQVENNTLNGGNIDSDAGASINTQDAKSGIKFIDLDINGEYGAGCANQVVSNNTISGFVEDISMVSIGLAGTTLCPAGPSHYTVSNNRLANARLYGVFVFGSTTGTISGNVASNTDAEGYTGPSFNFTNDTSGTVTYIDGEYDYYDADFTPVQNTWSADSGNGYSFPLSIEGSLPPGVTTTTLPPVTTTTTSTTIPIRPAIAASGARLKANSVSMTVSCTGATCVGALELTKTVTAKVQIKHTKRYRTKKTIENLGLTRYTLLAGQSRSLTVRLNAKGLKMERSIKGGSFSCTLNVTSTTGVLRKIVSFKRP